MYNNECTGRVISFPKYSVGQIIHHKRFDYRGVVFKVDVSYQGTEDWYDQMALTFPPKDRPWYHIMVHNTLYTTYVAEKNLEDGWRKTPINHPLVNEFFSEFSEGRYVRIFV